MEEPPDVSEEDEERVLALVLQEEERLRRLKLESPPEEEPKGLPLGSIVLALEEIDRGQVGLGVLREEPVQIQALELIHRYANALVVVQPNLVKEYGAVSGTIKAPRRAIEDLNDVTMTVDKTITTEEEVDIRVKLSNRVPRFIRILVDQTCTLEYQTPRGERKTFPEGLDANTPLEATGEAWVTIWVTPTTSTSLKIYASTSSAIGVE